MDKELIDTMKDQAFLAFDVGLALALNLNAAVVYEIVKGYTEGIDIKTLMGTAEYLTERKIREALKKLEFADLIVSINPNRIKRTKIYFTNFNYEEMINQRETVSVNTLINPRN